MDKSQQNSRRKKSHQSNKAKLKGNLRQVESQNGHFDPSLFDDVLHKKIVYVIRDFVPKGTCKIAVKRFSNHPGVKKELVIPPVLKLGPSMTDYEERANNISDFDAYFKQRSNAENIMHEIFSGETPLEKVFKQLSDYYHSRNIAFSPLFVEGKQTNVGILRDWYGEDSQGLAACFHEDFLQRKLDFPSFLGLSRMKNMGSVVICLENGIGGQTIISSRSLTIKEICGDPQNIVLSDGGFKPSLLEGWIRIEVELQAGDILFFSPALIHAVKKPTEGRRVTLQTFFAEMRQDPQTITRRIIYFS